jgi:HAE1 family hydrophobic/amphiphilic exporter-1
VLFSIPLAFIGALLALALTMKSLSIFTILGMIMLVGLVAKNAILLVDFANQMKAEGMDTRNALLEAGRTRLRPILMTTVAMVIGMLPIAIADGAGAEWKNGLGWALIGGLTSSMFLTLLVVPVMYYAVDKLKDRVTGKGKGPKGPTLDELLVAPPDPEIAARFAHLHGSPVAANGHGSSNGHAPATVADFPSDYLHNN